MHAHVTSDGYEKLLAELAEALYRQVEGLAPDDVRYGRSNRWKGISGHWHQIDVSVTGPADVMLIECKCWAKEVPVGMVLAFLGRLVDIGPVVQREVHGMIVTTIGFQPGAKKVASHHNIHAEVVRSAHEFALTYKQYRKLAIVDVGKATDEVRVQRHCGICGSELAPADAAATYLCPLCNQLTAQ